MPTTTVTKRSRRPSALILTLGLTVPFTASAHAKGTDEPKKAEAPVFKSAWKIDLPADSRRVAVADVTGDGKARLLVLSKAGTLHTQKMVDGKLEKEASVELGKDPTQFIVGRFAKGKPPMIVAPGGTFYWDKDKFLQKPGPEEPGSLASIRLKDGSESFFIFSLGGPPTTYTIDLSATKIYQPGTEPPQPTAEGGDYREIVAEFPASFFEMQSFPDEVKKGGIARLFDPRNEGKIYGLLAWQEAKEACVALFEGKSLFPEPQADAKPIWKSDKIPGKVLDIAIGPDVKGGKQTGFYVLQEAGPDNKGRVLEFFALGPKS